MISSKAEVELKKISDLALKKGAVNEEDIYYRLLKYEISAEDIEPFFEETEALFQEIEALLKTMYDNFSVEKGQ